MLAVDGVNDPEVTSINAGRWKYTSTVFCPPKLCLVPAQYDFYNNCVTTGPPKPVVCAVLSVGMCI